MTAIEDAYWGNRSFCTQRKISKSTFGLHVVNDGKLVNRLRDGKGITLKTITQDSGLPDKNRAATTRKKKHNDNNEGESHGSLQKRQKQKRKQQKRNQVRKSQASKRAKEERKQTMKLLSAFMIIARITWHLSTPAMKNPLFPSVSPRNFNTFNPALRLCACSMPEWVMLRFYQTVCAICITNIRRCRISSWPRKSAWKMCA